VTVTERNLCDRHTIVMIIVTEKRPYISGFFADVTMMTVMTVICSHILSVGTYSAHQRSVAGVGIDDEGVRCA
jgi:hypothetical protein